MPATIRLVSCATILVTPTPTAPPPTSTTVPVTVTTRPTETPTKKPTQPIDKVLGEKTPGASAVTPIAPSTGSGLFGNNGGNSNFLLAILGIFALSGGLALITFGRRSTRS